MKEFCQGMERACDPESVFAQITEAARHLGFEQCAYAARRPLPLASPRIALLSNYDPRWQKRYLDAGYLAIDPTVAHAWRSVEPIVWSDQLFRGAAQMWEKARSFELVMG